MGESMRYVLAGASGFLGKALTAQLTADGHDVTRLVRREPEGPHESHWDPAHGEVDAGLIAGADVVVNLAGASIGRVPWTASYRQTLLRSRTTTTNLLATTLSAVPEPPVFVAQSGIDYYGKDRGPEDLDEDAEAGEGFLADLCREWEQAAAPAELAGARVVRLRTSIVLDRSGGMFPLMTVPFRLGLGGRLGSGSQVMTVIALTDWIGAVRFLVERPDCRGAYNLTLPHPPTNAEFTAALGAALHRPTRLPVPGVAIRTALGELSEGVLGSARVLPRRLLEAGFSFAAPDVTTLVDSALHRG